jgi:hypothetical protein
MEHTKTLTPPLGCELLKKTTEIRRQCGSPVPNPMIMYAIALLAYLSRNFFRVVLPSLFGVVVHPLERQLTAQLTLQPSQPLPGILLPQPFLNQHPSRGRRTPRRIRWPCSYYLAIALFFAAALKFCVIFLMESGSALHWSMLRDKLSRY